MYKLFILTHFIGKEVGSALQPQSAFPKLRKLKFKITKGKHEIRIETDIEIE